VVFAKKVARAIDKTIDCKRVGVAVLGLEVPHAHIHLVPLNSLHDIEFSRPKLQLSKEEFEDVADKISSAID
jgi:histidine triad (HIT) family protein